jgi:type VI secretion system protein VasD
MANAGSVVRRTVLGILALTFAVGAPLGAFVACGPTIMPIKEPQKCNLQMIDMTLIGSERINQTDNGDPRPVQVRIYQLATDVRLNNANFRDVWKDDKAVLKEDLIKVEELTVYPDSRTDVKFERDEKAMYIAAVALFRTPKGRSWYTVLELPPPPGKGECFASCPSGDCGDGGADGGKTLPPLNPHFVIWVDGSKIDEGSDHVDDYPQSGRHIQTQLKFSSPEDKDNPGKSEK